jgi:hypothetical protein
MSSQIYSREYLQNIPKQRKLESINHIIHSFINDLQIVASSGKSSYLYEIPATSYQLRTPYIPGHAISVNTLKRHNQNMDTSIPPTWQFQPTYPILDLDEVLQGIKNKFPDCKVSYEETWIEDTSRQTAGQITKTLKKGIVIDWS